MSGLLGHEVASWGGLLVALGIVLVAQLAYMTVWFTLSTVRRRTDLVDQAWGPAFVFAGVVMGVLAGFTLPYVIALALVTVWGGRLFLHIFLRHRKNPEDPRYIEIEARGPGTLLSRYVTIYLLQGVLSVAVCMPVIVYGYGQGVSGFGWTWAVAFGATVWLVGFLFEAVGDHQLKMFINNPANAGQIMSSGLWRYTRHPNYFGEVTMWWGLWLLAYNPENPDLWAASVVGPLLITYLIVFVSGIPPIERAWADREDFRRYKERTSALIPWFPKKE